MADPELGTITDETSDGTLWGDVRDFVGELLLDVFEMVQDFFLWVVSQLLDFALLIVGAIPVPDFIVGGFQWDGVQMILYFLDRSEFGVALAIVGAGYTFRLTRKLMTLGQW